MKNTGNEHAHYMIILVAFVASIAIAGFAGVIVFFAGFILGVATQKHYPQEKAKSTRASE